MEFDRCEICKRDIDVTKCIVCGRIICDSCGIEIPYYDWGWYDGRNLYMCRNEHVDILKQLDIVSMTKLRMECIEFDDRIYELEEKISDLHNKIGNNSEKIEKLMRNGTGTKTEIYKILYRIFDGICEICKNVRRTKICIICGKEICHSCSIVFSCHYNYRLMSGNSFYACKNRHKSRLKNLNLTLLSNLSNENLKYQKEIYGYDKKISEFNDKMNENAEILHKFLFVVIGKSYIELMDR